MKKSYEDYIAEIYECYEDYKIEDKLSTVEAIARTLYDFEGLMSRSETEKAIILIIYGQLIVTEQLRVLDFTKENLIDKLNHIDFMLIRQEQSLTTEQYDDLQSKYNNVLKNINNMQVDNCRMARWFYEELTEEVNIYFVNFKSDEMNSETITSDLLKRFKRDCKNTISEKMIVYTTLGEILLANNFIIPDEIIEEIKGFDVNETENQLLQIEKEQLIKRIAIILGKNK